MGDRKSLMKLFLKYQVLKKINVENEFAQWVPSKMDDQRPKQRPVNIKGWNRKDPSSFQREKSGQIKRWRIRTALVFPTAVLAPDRYTWKQCLQSSKGKWCHLLGTERYSINIYSNQIRSDQSLSRVRFFATPWIAARQASLSITNSRSSPRLMSIESVMPSSHLILCHPLLLLPPIPPSIRVFFQWVNSLHEVAKALEFLL